MSAEYQPYDKRKQHRKYRYEQGYKHYGHKYASQFDYLISDLVKQAQLDKSYYQIYRERNRHDKDKTAYRALYIRAA